MADEDTNLTDSEAYSLLRAIAFGREGTELGRAFRESLWYFELDKHDKGHIDPDWSPPPEAFRLPIDNEIDRLISRNHEPRIKRPMDKAYSGPLRWFSAYHLVRSHLHQAAQNIADPAHERSEAERGEQIIEELEAAQTHLLSIVGRPWWEFTPRISRSERLASDTPADEHTPTNKIIVAAHYQLIDAYETLLNLQRLVEQERSLARVNEQATGRPRLMWKADFVWRMAHLWRILTDQEPSKADDSLFGSFVYAAWNSFDESVPEISFARAIRERT